MSRMPRNASLVLFILLLDVYAVGLVDFDTLDSNCAEPNSLVESQDGLSKCVVTSLLQVGVSVSKQDQLEVPRSVNAATQMLRKETGDIDVDAFGKSTAVHRTAGKVPLIAKRSDVDIDNAQIPHIIAKTSKDVAEGIRTGANAIRGDIVDSWDTSSQRVTTKTSANLTEEIDERMTHPAKEVTHHAEAFHAEEFAHQAKGDGQQGAMGHTAVRGDSTDLHSVKVTTLFLLAASFAVSSAALSLLAFSIPTSTERDQGATNEAVFFRQKVQVAQDQVKRHLAFILSGVCWLVSICIWMTAKRARWPVTVVH